MWAAMHNSVNVAKILVHHEAKLIANDSMTALMMATTLEMVQVLAPFEGRCVSTLPIYRAYNDDDYNTHTALIQAVKYHKMDFV